MLQKFFPMCTRSRNVKELNDSFHEAIKVKNITEVARLLYCGADVNSTNKNGNTALHQCSLNFPDFTLVKQLLDAGAQIDAQNSKGETPLHVASKKSNTELAKLLISCGAKVNAQNSLGDTPLHLAYTWGSSEDSGMFIKSGADMNMQNARGETPLHVACRSGNCTLANLLVDSGAVLDMPNESKETPLHVAAHYGNYTIANILLRNNAKPDAQNYRGDTPLHVVARFDRRFCDKPTATDLLNRGARVDIKNNDGKTAYDLCSSSSLIRIAIKEHVIKLSLLNLPVQITVWSEKDLTENTFVKNCLKELEIIGNTKFDQDCTLDIIFSKMDNPYYLRDMERVEVLESVLYSTFLVDQFPLYAHVLRLLYEKTKNRFNLLTAASESFSYPTRLKIFTVLPNLVREKILLLLADEDLQNFLESGEGQ